MILQQKKPDDFVIATGKNKTIKEFVNIVCNKLNLNVYWKGKGLTKKQSCEVITKLLLNVIKNILDHQKFLFYGEIFLKQKKC